MLFQQRGRIGFVGGVIEQQRQHVVEMLDRMNVLQVGQLVHHRQPAAELLEAALQCGELQYIKFLARHAEGFGTREIEALPGVRQ